MKKYFVVHLCEDDSEWREGFRYQVQLLDRYERARAAGCFGDETRELEVAGEAIPGKVLTAAKRQPMGTGDYVDEKGNSVLPGFLS